MRCARGIRWLAGLVAIILVAGPAGGQAPDANPVTSAADDSASPAPDSTTPKKKGGLFGKVKGLAGNKVVQQVAKTAACTMVPGGQAIAGAIDAASSKSAGEAVAGAAGAAIGGTGCMPGGMGGPGVAGAAAQAAAAEAAAAQAGAAAGYGAPMSGMPSGAMGLGEMEGMPGPEEIAQCMGLTVEEYQDFTDPTRGEPRQMTKDEMKRQAKLGKKVDMRRYQACMMQQMSRAGN